MKRDEWRDRLRAAGLRQADIARMLGYGPEGVSRALSRTPPSAPVCAIIRAAEIMTVEQRARWLEETTN